jgi:hypothetical protein
MNDTHVFCKHENIIISFFYSTQNEKKAREETKKLHFPSNEKAEEGKNE